MLENALSKIKTLFKDGFFHIFVSNVISKMIVMLSGIIVVRLLTKSEYGLFSYAHNIYSFIFIFSGFGLTSAFLQIGSEAEDSEAKKKVYSFCTRCGIAFNFFLGVVIAVISVWFPLAISESRTLLFAFCLLPIFEFVFAMQQTSMRCSQKNKEYAEISLIYTIVSLISAIVCCLLWQAYGRVFGLYLSLLVVCLILSIAYKERLCIKKSELSSEQKKDILKIGVISMINDGLSHLLYLIDIFMLGVFIADETVVASYKVATTIPTALMFVPFSVVVFAYPYYVKNRYNKEWLLKNFKILLLAIGAFNLLVVVALLALAPWLVPLLFGAEYTDAIMPFGILCISYFFSGTFRIIAGNLLITQRKLLFNTIEAILSGVLNIVLNIILILNFGSTGAAIATLITIVFSGVLSTSYLVRAFCHANALDRKREV